MRAFIVDLLVWLCRPPLDSFGCHLARWSCELDERWNTGRWTWGGSE